MVDMETSVLRAVSETATDIKYEIKDEAVALFHKQSPAIWNKHICGEILMEFIHEGLSHEFVNSQYTFDKTQADRWIQVLPTKNSHVGTYNVKLKLKYKDPDYSSVFAEVPFKIKVLPCEIKRTVT